MAKFTFAGALTTTALINTALTATLAALVTGCFDPPKPACAFLCGTDSSCPSGYTCAGDGWCKRDDVAPSFVCEPGTVDAAVADAPATDAAEVDAAEVDAAMVDAGTTDAGEVDATSIDASVPRLEIITASPLAFGAVAQTASATQTVMVRNSGAAPSSALTVDVTGTDFTRVSGTDTCMGATLPALGTCSFEARFAPATLGPATGVAAVSATAGGTVSINLTGTGAPMLTASPTSVGFGDVASGATPERTVTLTNAGTVTTGTLTAAVTGDARFSIATDSCSAATVAAAGTCAVAVRFTASSAGDATGTLTVTGTPGGPVTVALTATGL